MKYKIFKKKMNIIQEFNNKKANGDEYLNFISFYFFLIVTFFFLYLTNTVIKHLVNEFLFCFTYGVFILFYFVFSSFFFILCRNFNNSY